MAFPEIPGLIPALAGAFLDASVQAAPEPDHMAAIATFLEICFGLNVACAAFKDFRIFMMEDSESQMKQLSATIGALEKIDEETKRKITAKVNDRLEATKAKHSLSQRQWCNVFRLISLLFCIIILVVLYFDWLCRVRLYMPIFLIPFPLYAGVAFLCQRRFINEAKIEVNRAIDFVTYGNELKDPQKTIKEGLQSLKPDGGAQG